MLDYTNPLIAHLNPRTIVSRAIEFSLGSFCIIMNGDPQYTVTEKHPVFLQKRKEGWSVMCDLGGFTNIWFLREHGEWNYKRYSVWPTYEAALNAFSNWVLSHQEIQNV